MTDNRATSEAGAGDERYRAMFEHAIECVFQSTPDGRILTANPALVEMLGYESEAQLRGVDAQVLYADPGRRAEIVRALQEGGEIRNAEIMLRARDGHLVHVLENSREVRDGDGKLLYYEGTLTNISGWREAESLFRSLAESSPVGIFISQGDRFTFVNSQFCSMVAMSEDALLATGPVALLGDADRDEAVQNAMDMISGVREDAFELRIGRPNGESMWVLATISLITQRGAPAVLGNLIDITERKQDRDLLHTLAASSPVALYIVQDGRFQFVNPQVMRLTGRSEHELFGMSPEELVLPEDRERVANSAQAMLGGDDARPYEHRLVSADGDVRWVMDTFTPIMFRGRPAALGTTIDITERKQAEEQLARQAFYDSLTELPNRALFMSRLEHALKGTGRSGKSVAVMFLDLDDFKRVNDTFGHAAGDMLLGAIGARLAGCIRPGDTVARIGGDEFTMLLDDVPARDTALRVAARIVERLASPFDLDGEEVTVGASVGIAFSEPGRSSASDLLRAADVALYHAKATGKGRYVVFGEQAAAA